MASSLFASHRSERIAVIGADTELAARLTEEQRRVAEPASGARILRRETGTWDSREDSEPARDGYGLLIIDGMLVRRMGYDGRFGAELLGPGDVLRPWEHDGEEAVLPFQAHWRVLNPLRL